MSADTAAPPDSSADATGDFVPSAAPARHPTGVVIRCWQPGMRFGGSYELLEKLDLSSLGEVWKARDSATPDGAAVVALHLLPPEIAENAQETSRISGQLEQANALTHDRIAAFIGLVRDRGESALVQELAPGVVLGQYRRDWVARHGSFPVSEALRLCGEIADGLDFAHSLGVSHGDLKPEAVVVDEAGAPRIVGFGMTDAIRSSLARIRDKAGDPGGVWPYRAPEAYDHDAPTPQSDQYSLAAIFYKLVSGYPPFASEDPAILRECVLNGTPDPLASLTPARNQALFRGLAKRPGDRFPTCRALVDALAGMNGDAAGAANPVDAAPETQSRPLPVSPPPLPPPPPPQSSEETAVLAEPPPVPPEPGPYASPRRSSRRQSEILAAREMQERRRSNRSTAGAGEGNAAATAPASPTTESGRNNWEDVEAVEETKRASVRWGGVAMVVVLLLGIVAAAFYDHRERERARLAEEAERAARLEAILPAPAPPPRPVEPPAPPPPLDRDAAAFRSAGAAPASAPTTPAPTPAPAAPAATPEDAAAPQPQPDPAERWLARQDLGFGEADAEGATLLHRLATVDAAQAEAILARFPDDGVDVDAADDLLETPLHKAMYFNNAVLARWLLGRGARLDAENWEGNTPVEVAVAVESVASLEALLDNGANVDQPDARGETLLHHAIRDNSAAVVAALLRRGADLEARDRMGRTSLLLASALARNRIVGELLAAGADVSARNDNGRNAAHLAALSGGLNTLRAVVEAGADPALADADGRTPLDLALDQLARYQGVRDGTVREPAQGDPERRIRSFTAIAEWLRQQGAE